MMIMTLPKLEGLRFTRRFSDVELPGYVPHPSLNNLWQEGDELFRQRINKELEKRKLVPIVLKSVEEEATDCRARCAGMKVGDLIMHCHHDALCETLTEPVENRISYILTSKRDNRALRLRLMGPPIVDAEFILADAEWVKAYAELNKAYAELNKAYAEWRKADAEWRKADTEWRKAVTAWRKANTEWRKADAARNKAYAVRYKADAVRYKAYAEWNKAYAELIKADAEWNKAYEPHYARLYPDSPWNGQTIFAGEFKSKESGL